MICNRDESRSRPDALPPVERVLDQVRVWYPRDPQGGGTWVAANGHGLALALLNRRAPVRTASAGPLRSRGRIVLGLAGASGIPQILQSLSLIDARDYAQFRLTAVLHRDVLIATSDGERLAMDAATLTAPIVFTSSSLSDDEAERRRIPLFRDLVLRAGDHLSGQRAFHDHRWPECPEFSVRMQRPDARTVSRTLVDVAGQQVSLTYEPLSPEP